MQRKNCVLQYKIIAKNKIIFKSTAIAIHVASYRYSTNKWKSSHVM